VWYASLAEENGISRTQSTVLFGWSLKATKVNNGFTLTIKQDAASFVLAILYLVPREQLVSRNLVTLSDHQGRPVLTHQCQSTKLTPPHFQKYL